MKRYYCEESYNESIYEEEFIADFQIINMGTSLRGSFRYELYQSQSTYNDTYYGVSEYSSDYYCDIRAFKIA